MSKLGEILKSPAVRNSRGLMAALVVSGLSIFAIVSMTGRVYLAYDHQQQINSQSAEMRQTIKTISPQPKDGNDQKYRAGEATQVPNVQSDIMLAIQSHQLQLKEMKYLKSSDKKEGKNQTFEMHLIGTYEQTIAFLQNFHSRDALIDVFKLGMKPEKGKGTVETDLIYRVYVK